jgi:hypothetical protein
MSDLRTAAQQALEVLIRASSYYDTYPEIAALEKALSIIEPEIKEDKPFGYFRAEPFGWTDCSPTDEGAIPLYTRPDIK